MCLNKVVFMQVVCMHGSVASCSRFRDMLAHTGGFGLRDPRVAPGNDSDGFFFSDGRLKHLRACENTDGEWGALSFPPAGISLLIKKLFCKGRHVQNRTTDAKLGNMLSYYPGSTKVFPALYITAGAP